MNCEGMGSTPNRREFIRTAGGAIATSAVLGALDSGARAAAGGAHTIRFAGPDSLFHGFGWETLNPGYWQIKGAALRRRFHNYGERARSTGFPFHYETHRRNGGRMSAEYDPSLPPGVIHRREWKLNGAWSISARFTHRGRAEVRREGDRDGWRMFQSGGGFMGFSVGAKSLFEGFDKIRNGLLIGWTDDGHFGFQAHRKSPAKRLVTPVFEEGDVLEITVSAHPVNGQTRLSARLRGPGGRDYAVDQVVALRKAEGYFGIAAEGLLDFELNELRVDPGENRPLDVG